MITSQSHDSIIGWHHVGFAVADLDRAVAFWSRHFGFVSAGVRCGAGGFLPVLFGRPEVALRAAFLDHPRGLVRLELVEFAQPQTEAVVALESLGAAHICLWVADLDDTMSAVLADGATSISHGVAHIDDGPLAGGRSALARTEDGVVLELHQAAAGSR